MATAREILDRVNSSNFEILYRCRWSPEAASETVPLLISLLADGDQEVVAEALRALHRIGPMALAARPAVCSALSQANARVRALAVSTLGRLCLEDPVQALSVLVEAADHAELLEPALLALINFGPAAASAAPLFRRHALSRSAKVRKLALRALRASGAGEEEATSIPRKTTAGAGARGRPAAGRKKPR